MVALELAFKGRWKFPEPQRGWCKGVSEKVGPLKWSFPNPDTTILVKLTTHHNTSMGMTVLYRL